MERQIMNGLYLEVPRLVDAVEVRDRLYDDLYFVGRNIVERRQFVRCRQECWCNNGDGGGLESGCDGAAVAEGAMDLE
jgi:hypothetical protein